MITRANNILSNHKFNSTKQINKNQNKNSNNQAKKKHKQEKSTYLLLRWKENVTVVGRQVINLCTVVSRIKGRRGHQQKPTELHSNTKVGKIIQFNTFKNSISNNKNLKKLE
jgi:hypothetical protein